MPALAVRETNPYVQVVVVVPEWDHDTGRPGERGVRAHVDELGTGRHEAVDEVLGEAEIDLAHSQWRPLAPVQARVIDIGVEAVLVRRVLGAEIPAVRTTEISDADPSCVRMGEREVMGHAENNAQEAIRSPPAPAAVRRAAQDGVPREVVRASR
jgi:hypothetical protein